MGFGVGIPILKLSNKVGGNASRKRTGTLRAVACEALEERWSRDPDIDRSRTHLNTYEGFRSGRDLMESMTQEAEAYSQRRREAGGRGLRSTASIGFVTVIKPDMDAIQAMTPTERKQFFQDSNEILDSILGRDNVRSRVIHRDELGEHEHVFRMGFTESGELSVDKLVNPRIWKRVNVEFPRKMREKGWDVEDCDMYDAAKAEEDPDYRESRRAKRKESGRGSSKYKIDADKAKAAALAADREALETLSAEIAAREAALEVRRQDLEARELAQRERARELDAQEAKQTEMKERQLRIGRDQATRQKDLNTREARITGLEAREAAVSQREATVAQREAAIPGIVREEVRKAMREEATAARDQRRQRSAENVRKIAEEAAKARVAGEAIEQRQQRNQTGYIPSV